MTSTVYALIHAAADDVESGALAARRVPALLAPTIIGALAAAPREPADPPA